MRVLMRTLRVAGTVVPAAALVVASAVPSAAAAGQLDPSFGVDGTVVSDFPDSYSGARAVAVQANGRIVAAGFAHTNNSVVSDFALTRYDASGALDPTFGSDGLVRTDFGGRFDDVLAIAIQPDAGIVVAGTSSGANGSDMAVARYTSDGTLDPSFDGDGMALVDFGNESNARAVALQRDGKIVLAGWALHTDGASCCSSDFALARLTRTGVLDTTFGNGGRVLTDFLPGADNGFDAAHAVVVQADGRIVAAGAGAGATGVDFAVARYRANGSLDPTFSRDGRLTTEFLGYHDEVRDLAVDTRGRIVTGGMSCEFPGNSDEVCDFGLARYTSYGALDQGFGRYGRVRTDLGADVNEGIRGLVVQTDGRIVATGETIGSGGWDVALVRYRSDGRLDRSFGVNGVVVTPVSSSTDEVGGLARQADGRLVVAGTASVSVSTSFGFFVSRYLAS